MSKLTADIVVTKLSVLGYNLITSNYKLERVEHGELLNHRLSYRLKDTNNKTGQVTFIDGRTSFKHGLAIDISIVDLNDIQRPIKINENDKFIKLMSVDYEKEQELLDKLTEDMTIQIDKKIDKLDLITSDTKELISKTTEITAKECMGIDEKLKHLKTQTTNILNLVSIINDRTTEMRNKQIEYTQKIIRWLYFNLTILLLFVIIDSIYLVIHLH